MEKDHILLKKGNFNYFNLKIYLAMFLLDNFVMDIDLVKESINLMTWKEILLDNGSIIINLEKENKFCKMAASIKVQTKF